jgi:hypothetical protein
MDVSSESIIGRLKGNPIIIMNAVSYLLKAGYIKRTIMQQSCPTMFLRSRLKSYYHTTG